MFKNIAILGVNISQITKKKAIETVDGWLSSSTVISSPTSSSSSSSTPRNDNFSFHFIVTPNPEMLVLTQKDNEFRDILNSADMAIPDGVGLLWTSRLLAKFKNTIQKSKISSVIPAKAGIYTNNQVLTERVSGTDLMLDLCQLASQKGYTVGLLGAKEGVAEKTAEALKKKFPGIKIKFAVSEISELSLRGRSETTDEAISKTKEMRLPRSAAYGVLARNDKISVDILFIAFGVPKQEKWIYNQITDNSKQLTAKVYMGVGGAFDLVSGKIKRAPKLMQDLGLEWLWRLIQEPKRIKRIWTAIVVFPWLVVKNLFKQPQSEVSSD